MPAASSESLAAHLLGLVKTLADARRCWVAYSGGLDSSVLLDLAAGLRERLPGVLAAVHVDHGLHPDSAAWAAHCAGTCAALGVPLIQRKVAVSLDTGLGPEAAARAARYDAMTALLEIGDLVLSAHHRDDQAETLVLALLRGAGVRGLAGMPAVAPLGPGRLVRPLLPFGRADLLGYARARGLSWIEDPSNRTLDPNRNWLRHRVLPLLAERYPVAGRSLARSAAHCAEADALVKRLAAAAATDAAGLYPGSLSVAGLRDLDATLCRAVLRHWIGAHGFGLPDTRNLARIMDEVLPARPDAGPLVAWTGCEVRRYRDALFALTPLPAPPLGVALPWADSVLALPARLGHLRLEAADGTRLTPSDLGPEPLRVRFGVPGLRCRPGGGRHRRPLKHLYQEAGIPPWLRGQVPLIFVGDNLVAIAHLCVCVSDGVDHPPTFRVVWTDHPWEAAGLLAPRPGGPGRRR